MPLLAPVARVAALLHQPAASIQNRSASANGRPLTGKVAGFGKTAACLLIAATRAILGILTVIAALPMGGGRLTNLRSYDAGRG
jgi:hypothetical protein